MRHSLMDDGERLYREGVRYRDGLEQGVLLNRTNAARYLLEAGKLGHPGAAAWMALLAKGIVTGFEEDHVEAEKWQTEAIRLDVRSFYERRALSGDQDAHYSLGILLEEGIAMELDYPLAFHHYTTASNSNFAPAQNNLALMYRRGLGTAIDEAQTLQLYHRAADLGYVIAQNNLGFLYKAKATAESRAQAFKWFMRAATAGYPSAQNNIGAMYRTGEGAPRDLRTACEWYTKAADQGHAISMNSLGVLYQNSSDDWPENKALAFEWYQRATCESLGCIFLQSLFVVLGWACSRVTKPHRRGI